MKRAVFLDRDGVLNDTFIRAGISYPPANVGETRILPGVSEALIALKNLGFLLIVVTNQPDVARATQTAAEVNAINGFLSSRLPLDDVRVCMHDTADGCDCRKPKPGMLLDAARDHAIELAASFMVGDRSGDILAGAAAGCRTFLVERPYSGAGKCRPDFVVGDLGEAAGIIVGLVKGGGESR